MKRMILIGCQGGKWGGTRTFVESLRQFLTSHGYDIVQLPRSNVKGSMYCLVRIRLDAIRTRYPGAVAVAQRPDDLYVFKLFNKNNKSICVLHGDNLRKMELKRGIITSRMYRSMERRGLRDAERVICVDNSTFETYVNRYPWLREKTATIPVGVNTSLFRPLDRRECRRALGISDDAQVMLVAARLEMEKNVRAAIDLVGGHLDIEDRVLVIAGAGKEEALLRDAARKVKRARVMFLGQIPYAKLPEVINACDVVLVPSLFESGPLIIIEAMACGVPTVSTDVGRAREYIGESGCGHVVRAVDREFAEKAESFLAGDPRIRAECTERVKMFSFHNTGESVLRLIQELEVID